MILPKVNMTLLKSNILVANKCLNYFSFYLTDEMRFIIAMKLLKCIFLFAIYFKTTLEYAIPFIAGWRIEQNRYIKHIL